MDDIHKEVHFSGTGGPPECREFVRSVRQQALKEGKSRDDEWIADYAATCFTDEAFDWFESLDEDVRLDWKLLRRELLIKYVTNNGDQGSPFSAIVPTPASAVASSPASSMITPAAMPPALRIQPPLHPAARPPAMPRRGRIRIMDIKTGAAIGWISTVTDNNRGRWTQGLCVVTRTLADAVYVDFTPGLAASQLHLRSGPNASRELGVIWKADKEGYPRAGTDYAGVVPHRAFNKPEDLGLLAGWWKGPSRTGMWSVAYNGEITAKWVSDLGAWPLAPMVETMRDGAVVLQLAMDISQHDCVAVRLEFEDV